MIQNNLGLFLFVGCTTAIVLGLVAIVMFIIDIVSTQSRQRKIDRFLIEKYGPMNKSDLNVRRNMAEAMYNASIKSK